MITTSTNGLVAGDVKVPAPGGAIPAYRAMPEGDGPFPVVLVVQEIFGVHEHIRDVCRRIAKLGYFAIAPELYSRQGDPAAISGELVADLARAGDPASQELFGELGGWLGVGLANLAAAFDPGRFVIGGGVSEAEELLLTPAREAFRRTLTGRGFRPEADVVRAGLGVDAGLIGAADLARDDAE